MNNVNVGSQGSSIHTLFSIFLYHIRTITNTVIDDNNVKQNRTKGKQVICVKRTLIKTEK